MATEKSKLAQAKSVPYYYQFEDRYRILLVVAYGSVDEDELRELYFDIRRRKDEEHSLTGILDLTEVTFFNVNAGVICGLALLPPNFVDPTLRAVVAPTDFLFGMARMFQITGSDTRRGLLIVRTLSEALSALNFKDVHFRKHEAA
jgi:hypothetical protein